MIFWPYEHPYIFGSFSIIFGYIAFVYCGVRQTGEDFDDAVWAAIGVLTGVLPMSVGGIFIVFEFFGGK